MRPEGAGREEGTRGRGCREIVLNVETWEGSSGVVREKPGGGEVPPKRHIDLGESR